MLVSLLTSILCLNLIGYYIAGVAFTFFFIIAYYLATNPTLKVKFNTVDLILLGISSTGWLLVLPITVLVDFSFFFPHAQEWLQEQVDHIVNIVRK